MWMIMPLSAVTARTPYRYLQNALGAAVSGDEIRVAQGIYRPDEDSAHPTGTGSRTATFRLKNGVVITGGYAGFGQPVPDARDPNTHETILSGDLLGNDGPDFANNYENSYHVVTGSGTDATAVLDGFTITAGNANENKNVPRGCGGGMYNQYGSPTVTNCIFSGNSASKGGGMYNNNSSPTVTNCTFSGNSVYQGGGMYNNDSSPTVTNCTFSGNSSSWTGGGMRNWESSPTVTNCMFSGNSSGWDGGGIQNASNSSSLLVNCMFAGNSAANGGGGMSNWRSSPTVANCTFSGNSGNGFGGGIHNFESGPTVTNCTFSRNSASRGGGMCNRSSSSATVTNCILWGNNASSGTQIYNDGTSSVTVSYSDVQGGWPSEGNINSKPLFVDQAIGDYHLLTGSPCIDAGDNSAVPPSVVTDLDGNPRIIDGTVDMGAYEGLYHGFLLSPELVVVPEGGTATFTVAPVVDPMGMLEVTVAVESGDPDITVESGGLLTFDSTNYSQPQTVTLAAAEDADQVHGTTVILVSAPGVYPADVTAYELDSEGPAVLYVDCDAIGANDGSSWENAFTDLREGLGFVDETFWAREIRVAQGAYYPEGPLPDFRRPTNPNPAVGCAKVVFAHAEINQSSFFLTCPE
ncbi:MAG: right-handed parallel beta-helix repeat-containing protein [Planctomycetota bacterium]